MKKETKSKGELPDREANNLCPNCGSKNIERVEENYTFTYGVGNEAEELSAIVPITKCGDCKDGFLDSVAEDICHEAICKYLQVMTPEQIRALRDLYEFTQARFCEITKLGEATLSRWERGIVVQNNAYDNYLYLLGFRENLDRLLKRQGQEIPTALKLMEGTMAQFREIKVTEELMEKQQAFDLQPCLITGE